MKEIIICAAIKLKSERVYRGHRHGICILAINDEEKNAEFKGAIQGFITSRNRFVDREEAMLIQKSAGINSAWTKDGKYNGVILFSEDLY